MREKILTSVIVPIYHGQKYINNLVSMIEKNGEFVEEKIELIFVNDSPDIPIQIDGRISSKINIVVTDNPRNVGIHQSRVNGYNLSKGKFILFLDQDDRIENSCISSQIKHIQDADMVVGNGYKEGINSVRKIYKTSGKQKLVLDEKIYLKAANQITSPGQCLIRRDAIPEEWLTFIIKENGGDDLFLWYLMFAKKSRIVLNEECIYTHVENGENTSNNTIQMLNSADNVIKLMKKCEIISKYSIQQYKKRIQFLKKLQETKGFFRILVYLKYFDNCLYKLYAYYR